jgi:hypothetical protein
MTKRTRLPPSPKPAPTPQPRPSNRTRAVRAERGLVGIEVALEPHLIQAIRDAAAELHLTQTGLVRQWAESLYAEQVAAKRVAKPAKNKPLRENRQAKSKKW